MTSVCTCVVMGNHDECVYVGNHDECVYTCWLVYLFVFCLAHLAKRLLENQRANFNQTW